MQYIEQKRVDPGSWKIRLATMAALPAVIRKDLTKERREMSHQIVPLYWIDYKKIRCGHVGCIHLLWAGPMAKSCEKGDESPDSIKGREFFDCLRDFQPLKTGPLIIMIMMMMMIIIIIIIIINPGMNMCQNQ
jgi:hypothetical protein